MRNRDKRLLETIFGFAAGGSGAWLFWGGLYALIAFVGDGGGFALLTGLGLTSPLAFGLALGISAAILLISAVILKVIQRIDKQNAQFSSQAPQSDKRDDMQAGSGGGFVLMSLLWIIGTIAASFASAGLVGAAVGFPLVFFGIPTLMLIGSGFNYLYKIFKDSSPVLKEAIAATQPLSPADAAGVGSAVVAAVAHSQEPISAAETEPFAASQALAR